MEERAQWVLDLWAERASIGYGATLREIRRKLGIGKGAAEEAIKVANEFRKEYFNDFVLNAQERLLAKYMELAEEAERAGDFRAARSILDSVRSFMGIGEPDRIEVTHKPEHLAEMTDEELELAAKFVETGAITEH